jgi:phytoene synthase
MTTALANEIPTNGNVVATSTEVLAYHGRSFRLASHFLPRQCRKDATVVYAMCRLIDDLVDEAPDPDTALSNLNEVRSELTGSHPKRPLVAVFLDVVKRRDIDIRATLHLTDAVLSDLDTVLVPDDKMLIQYCYGVAGTVGLMMCGVLGVRDPLATAHAIDLGIAMQITNICRDVLEDAAMGRVYLPASRLKQAGTSPQALLDGTADPEAVASVVRDLLCLAERYYSSGEHGLHYIPAKPRTAIVVASRVYRSIGLRLLRIHSGNALAGRTVVPTWERIIWVIRGLFSCGSKVVRGHGTTPHQSNLHHSLIGFPGANT